MGLQICGSVETLTCPMWTGKTGQLQNMQVKVLSASIWLNLLPHTAFSQMITESTHHQDDSDTLIDLFLTSTRRWFRMFTICPALGFANTMFYMSNGSNRHFSPEIFISTMQDSYVQTKKKQKNKKKNGPTGTNQRCRRILLILLWLKTTWVYCGAKLDNI